MNEIEQINDGTIYCIPYNDNGKYKAIILNNKGDEVATLDLNEICGIDDKSKPIIGLINPLVTACFNGEGDIFFSVYHRLEMTMHYFLYSW